MSKLPEKDEIRKAINEYCLLKDISKERLSKITDVSSATLSKIENGDWESINDRLWLKIWNIIRPIGKGFKLVETHNLKTVNIICEKAQINQYMIAVKGGTGLGKTTALKRFSRKRNVYYVCFEPTMKPKQFFKNILREMGVGFEGTIYEMVNRISEELSVQESPLIIIDECCKLVQNATMVSYLKVLRDKTESSTGIVLAGMPYMFTYMMQYRDRQKMGYPELYRRINDWYELRKPTRNEVDAICEANEVTDSETRKNMLTRQNFGDIYNDFIEASINQTLIV